MDELIKYQGVEIKDIMIGDEATALRSMLQITYPVSFCSTVPSCPRELKWAVCLISL